MDTAEQQEDTVAVTAQHLRQHRHLHQHQWRPHQHRHQPLRRWVLRVESAAWVVRQPEADMAACNLPVGSRSITR